MSKKNDKRGNSSLKTYIIIIASCYFVILLAILSAFLINTEKNGNEISASEKLINRNGRNCLRLWRVIIDDSNKAGKTNMPKQ